MERRGGPALADIKLGRAYFQDDVPIRHARALRGHAVRALYLACGVVDLAVETGDDELLQSVIAQWEHAVATRTYLTGGMGSRHTGEAFGEDFELPPDRAYAETCASVASVMLSWRLLLATGDPRYADLAERTLYNVVATSPALDGRVLLLEPFATARPRIAVQLHQLTPCTVRTPRGAGLRVETDYPWSGTVTVRVEEAPSGPPGYPRGGHIDGTRRGHGPGPRQRDHPDRGRAHNRVDWEDAVALRPRPGPLADGRLPLVLIPYHLWGNRGPTAMRVWPPDHTP